MELIDSDTAVRRLFGAVILQALDDATQTRRLHLRRRARIWLKSPACGDCLAWLGWPGVNIDALLATGAIRPRGHWRSNLPPPPTTGDRPAPLPSVAGAGRGPGG